MASILENLSEDQGKDPAIAETLSKLVEIRRNLDFCFNGPDVNDQTRAMGFVMLMFAFDDTSGACTYMANTTDRAQIIAALRYQADMLECNADLEQAENWPLNRKDN